MKLNSIQIIRRVAEAHGIDEATIRGRSRRQAVLDARQIASQILRSRQLSLPKIGQLFNRSHSTVFHSLKKFRERVGKEPNYRARYEAILAALEAEEYGT